MPRPASPEAKRRLILDAARGLLVRRGFQDVVLDDVAREADVAKGTLFLYFKSKDELVSAAFADLVDRLGEALEALPRSNARGLALLTEAARTILSYLDANHDFLSQLGAGRLPGCGSRPTSQLMQKVAANNRRLVKVLELCGEPGVWSPEGSDLAGAASTLFALCRSATFYRGVTGSPRPLVSQTERIVSLFLYGVRGKP